MVSCRVNGLAKIIMAMSAHKLAVGFCVATALLLSAAHADVALADKDDRSTTVAPPPLSTIPPTAQAPAVAGIDLAIDRLEQSGRLTGLPVDWAGVKSYYAAGGIPLWSVPEGYSLLG